MVGEHDALRAISQSQNRMDSVFFLPFLLFSLEGKLFLSLSADYPGVMPHGNCPNRYQEAAVMKAFFDDLREEYQNGFFVHITEEQKDLELTAAYVGRYARRPSLSELRIKDYTGEFVTFEFKDYRNNGGKVLHTLRTVEFIKNLVQHIPPHYFNVIRHYGLLASRVKTTYKKLPINCWYPLQYSNTENLGGKADGISRERSIGLQNL
ncbi:hypothetical protein CCP3SC1_200008 [Gammaproteobacteria bacterium]